MSTPAVPATGQDLNTQRRPQSTAPGAAAGRPADDQSHPSLDGGVDTYVGNQIPSEPTPPASPSVSSSASSSASSRGPDGPDGPGPAHPVPSVPRNPSWKRAVSDAVVAGVWAVVSSASGLLVGALPLVLLLCKASTFSFLQAMGITIAATAGMWAANTVGVWFAVQWARRATAPPVVNPPAALAAKATRALARAPGLLGAGQQPSERLQVSNTMRAVLAQSPAYTQMLAVLGADAFAPEHVTRDARDRGLTAFNTNENQHGNQRIYLPTAPHARPMEGFPQATRNARSRNVLAQLGQSDGSGFNLIDISGTPSTYWVSVATLLDGLFVATADRFFPLAGGEALWGMFAGAWSGFWMLGGETGVSHPQIPFSLRFNGSRTLVRADHDSVAGEGDGLDLVGTHKTTQGSGGAFNAAMRLCVKWRPQLFGRNDVTRRSYATKVETIGLKNARERHKREQARNTLSGLWRGATKSPMGPAAVGDTLVSFIQDAKTSRRVELTEEVTRGALGAMGLPPIGSTAASLFGARHDVDNQHDSLTLTWEPQGSTAAEKSSGAPASNHWRLSYKVRELQSLRWLMSFTGGLGFDQGKAHIHQDEWTVCLEDNKAVQEQLFLLRTQLQKAGSKSEAQARQQQAQATLQRLRQSAVNTHTDKPARTSISGDSQGYDVGLRYVPIIGSGFWADKAPKSFAWAANWQRRDVQFDEHKRPFALASAGEKSATDTAEPISFWAGRILDSRQYGPLGSRSSSVWARVIGGQGSNEDSSILFEALFEQSAANAYGHESYVYAPIKKAFGLETESLPMAAHGDWRVQKTVRLTKLFHGKDDWSQATASLGELGAHMEAFVQPSANAKRTASQLRDELQVFMHEQGHKTLGLFAAASGATKPHSPRATAAAVSSWLNALGDWHVEVTSEQDKRPLTAWQTSRLEVGLSREQIDSNRVKVRATAALIEDEPLATRQSKDQRLADVWSADTRWRQAAPRAANA